MKRTATTISSILILCSSILFAVNPVDRNQLPAHKQAAVEPVGHDVVPGYEENKPINDVIQSATNRELQTKVNAPQNRVQRNINYGEPQKDYTKIELDRLLQRANTNKRSLSKKELAAVEEYIQDLERQKASNYKNNNTIGANNNNAFSGYSRTQIISDDFSYSDGSLIGNGSWVTYSGSTPGQVQVSGGSVLLTDSDSEDVRAEFAPVSTGTLYFGLDVQITDPTTYTGTDFEYFVGFSDTSGYSLYARTDAAAFSATGWSPGIANGSSTAEATWATELSYATTYRIVVGIDISTGISDLWVDPASSSDTKISGTGTVTIAEISGLFFRQSSASPDLNISVDNLVVSDVFSDVITTSSTTTNLSESFEGSTFPPLGWEANIVSGSYNWDQSSSYSSDGSYSARYNSYSASSGSEAELITTRLDLTSETSPTISFDWRHSSSYYDDSLSVYGSDDGGTTWARLGGSYSQGGSSFQSDTLSLSTLSGDNVYVKFIAYSDYGTYLYLDNISGPEVWVDPSPVANLSTSSLDFGQVNTSSTSSKTVVLTNSGGSALSGTVASDETEFTVGTTTIALAAGASDTINITYTPSAEGTQSGNVVFTHNGTSSPDTVTVTGSGTTSLLIEGFENDAWTGSPAAPPGWSQITVSGTNVWERKSSSYYAHTGSYSAKGPWASAGGEHLLITPGLDLGDGTDSYKLVFWVDGGYSAGTDLYVQISSSNTTEGDFTDTLATYIAGSTMPSSYAEQIINLTGYTGTQYLAFRMVDDDGYSVYIDDIEVELIPPEPTLSLNYSSVSFFPNTIGSTSTSDAFTVGTNSGAGALAIDSIKTTNSDYSASLTTMATGDTVIAGGNVDLDLSWTASTFGMTSSDVIIWHNAASSPDTFKLIGEAGYQYVDFDDQTFPSGWSIIDNDTVNGYGYDDGWIFNSSYGPGYGGYYARSHFNVDGANDWMIPSKLSVVSGDSVIFRSNSSSSSIMEDTLHVYVSTTDNEIASFTTEIGEILSQGYTNLRSAFDLSTYAGQDIYVAIVHHGSAGSNYWSYRKVDDVLLPARWVNPVAEALLSTNALDFGGTFTDYPTTQTFTITNNGSPDLTITGITSDDAAVAVTPTTATLGYDSSATFTVTLTATVASDTGAATLSIVSNDATNPTLSVDWITAEYDLAEFAMSTGISDTISAGSYPDYLFDDANDTISIVDNAGLMESMMIFVNLDHTYMGDLDFTLTAPNGDAVVFFDGVGGSGNDMFTVVFDGGSNTTAPFFPDAPSSNSLDAFVSGTSANGNWSLNVHDNWGGDDGILFAWGIKYAEGISGFIAGTVTNSETGLAVENVLVSAGNSTLTSSDGSYLFEVLDGELGVDFTKEGYNSAFFTAVVDSGDTVVLNVALTPENIDNLYSTGFETGEDVGTSSSNSDYDFAVLDTMFTADDDTILPSIGTYMLAYPDTAGVTYNNDDLVIWLSDSVVDIATFASLQMSLDGIYDTESNWDYFYVGLLLDDGFIYYSEDGALTGSQDTWETINIDVSWATNISASATPAIIFDSDGSVSGYWGGAFDNIKITGNTFFLAPPTALVAENYGATIPLAWDAPASGGRVTYELHRADLDNINNITRPMIEDENGQMVELVKGPRDYEQLTVDYQYSGSSTRSLSHYNVFRADWPFGGFALLGTTTTNSYDDAGVSDGDYLDYFVTAVYDEGETVSSNTVSARAGLPLVFTDDAFGGEDFEGGFDFADWEQFNSTDAAEWVVGDSAAADSAFGIGSSVNPAPDHTNFAYISDGRAGDADFQSILISPFLDFVDNHTAVVSLAGYAQVWGNFAGNNEALLLIRADMGDWQKVIDYGYDHNSGWGNYSASIGQLVGGSDYVQLAVVYTHVGGLNSGYGNGIAIDDLKLDIIPGPHSLALAPTTNDLTLTWVHPDSTMNLLRDPVDPSENRQPAAVEAIHDLLDLSHDRSTCYSHGSTSSGWITGFYGPDSAGGETAPTFAALHTFNEGPMELDEVVIHGYYNTDDTTTARADIFVGVADLTGATTDTIATGISFFDISATGSWTEAALDLTGLSYNSTDSTYLKITWTPLDTGYVALFGAQLWIPGQQIDDPNTIPANNLSGYDSAGVFTPSSTYNFVMEVCGTPTPPAISYNVYKDGIVVVDGLEETTWTDDNVSVVTESCYWVKGVIPMSFNLGTETILDSLIETDPTNVECGSAINQPPSEFSLLSPSDGDTILITPDNVGSNQLFAWTASSDPNGTQVEYDICWTLSSPFWQECENNGTQTANFVPLAEISDFIDSLYQEGGDVIYTFTWTVYATDGMAETEAVNGPRSITFDAGYALGVNDELGIPDVFALHQNYPNPFNPVTTIRFDVPEESRVRMDVYNVLGQRVATLVNSTLQPGFHTIRWNGTNDFGKPLASGMYIYQIKAKGFVDVKKLVLMK